MQLVKSADGSGPCARVLIDGERVADAGETAVGAAPGGPE
jgi:hypothetical protein